MKTNQTNTKQGDNKMENKKIVNFKKMLAEKIMKIEYLDGGLDGEWVELSDNEIENAKIECIKICDKLNKKQIWGNNIAMVVANIAEENDNNAVYHVAYELAIDKKYVVADLIAGK